MLFKGNSTHFFPFFQSRADKEFLLLLDKSLGEGRFTYLLNVLFHKIPHVHLRIFKESRTTLQTFVNLVGSRGVTFIEGVHKASTYARHMKLLSPTAAAE